MKQREMNGIVIPAKAGIQPSIVIPVKTGIQPGFVIPAQAGIQRPSQGART